MEQQADLCKLELKLEAFQLEPPLFFQQVDRYKLACQCKQVFQQ